MSREGHFVELTLYNPDTNKRQVYHRDFSGDSVEASKEKCRIRMGNNSVSEKDGIYSVVFREGDLLFEFQLVPSASGFGVLARTPFKKYSF